MTAAAPSTSRSTGRGILLATVSAAVVASLVNAVVSLVAQAAGADPSRVLGLMPGAYVVFTVVGVLAGVLGWVVVRQRAADPAAVLRWLVPTVVVVSLVPDVLLGLSGVGWVGVVGLMVMHVVVAVCTVAALRRFLPLPA